MSSRYNPLSCARRVSFPLVRLPSFGAISPRVHNEDSRFVTAGHICLILSPPPTRHKGRLIPPRWRARSGINGSKAPLNEFPATCPDGGSNRRNARESGPHRRAVHTRATRGRSEHRENTRASFGETSELADAAVHEYMHERRDRDRFLHPRIRIPLCHG